MMVDSEGQRVLFTSSAVWELYLHNQELGGDDWTPEQALAQALLSCGADAGEYGLAREGDQVEMGVVFPQGWGQ